MDNTIAQIATAPGVGGIAVIRISGEEAFNICNKVFKPINKTKDVLSAKGYTAMFGNFVLDNKIQDEVVALFFKAPKSYTGENVVELSCHGGKIVSENLLKACILAGAKPADRGEFTKRAFLNGRINLTQAEAVFDIISANSNTAQAVAFSALNGALYNKIEEIKNSLTVLVGHITAYVDYPEENVPELEDKVLNNTLLKANNSLDELIKNYNRGSVLKRGIETAIVGSPNVGKSTLLNLLSGFERAIVTSIEGTTRDIVEQQVMIAGVQLILSDTAGIRITDDEIEAEGIKRAYKCMDKAGLILAVFDNTKPFDKNQEEFAKSCVDKIAIAIVNKDDLEPAFDIAILNNYFKKVISISAKDVNSINIVENAIEDVLQIKQIDTDLAYLANTRQFDSAVKAKNAIQDAINAINMGITLDAIGVCIDDALYALYELTGENVSEAVIEEVFSKFCVGK